MPDQRLYNLAFRPDTYWDYVSRVSKLINAAVSKKSPLRLVEKDEAPATANEKRKDESVRILLDIAENLHPVYLAGQFLPDYEPDEVEIARIVLDNHAEDVYSIRARKGKKKISYRVVDEYITKFTVPINESDSELTFAELIQLIDGIHDIANDRTGFTNPFRDYNTDSVENLEEQIDFVVVTSLFYPELLRWYHEESIEWFEKIQAQR